MPIYFRSMLKQFRYSARTPSCPLGCSSSCAHTWSPSWPFYPSLSWLLSLENTCTSSPFLDHSVRSASNFLDKEKGLLQWTFSCSSHYQASLNLLQTDEMEPRKRKMKFYWLKKTLKLFTLASDNSTTTTTRRTRAITLTMMVME